MEQAETVGDGRIIPVCCSIRSPLSALVSSAGQSDSLQKSVELRAESWVSGVSPAAWLARSNSERFIRGLAILQKVFEMRDSSLSVPPLT